MGLVSLFTILIESPSIDDFTVAIALIAVGASVLLYQFFKRKARN